MCSFICLHHQPVRIMPQFANSRRSIDASVARLRHTVINQRLFITTLDNEDARLHDARLLLKNMLLSLAAAELSQAICSYHTDELEF